MKNLIMKTVYASVGIATVQIPTMVFLATGVQAAGGSYSPYGPYAPHIPEDTGAPEIALISIIGAILYAAGFAMVLNAQKIKGLLGK